MIQHERYWHAKKITLIGALVNAFLGIIKVIGGYLFHSHALLADGIHSFSDLVTDTMVLFAAKYGSLDADAGHPYGHQRIETAATLFLALLLCLAGFGIAWDALDEIYHGTHTMPDWLSLPIICISILANEILFHYTRHVGIKINSQLISANAWHHRSDAASSLVVLCGLLASLAGYVALDAVAAVIVGLMIIKMGWSYGWNSVKELVDSAVDADVLRQIERVIKQVDGVLRVHQLRSRFMGSDILIDVHIQVAPKISVSEGHYIAQHVHRALTNQIISVKDVTVHIDPEDDETSSPSLHLPSRKTIADRLFEQIHRDFPQISYWDLHYLDGKISIDIICTREFTQWKALHERVVTALQAHASIDEVRLLSLHETVCHK